MTFGGSGIPNHAVMVNTNQQNLGVTLGLTAHQRYGNPAVTNDGSGTFFALAGIDDNPPSPANPYARWNFGFYIGGQNAANYNYELRFDFDPAGSNGGLGRTWLIPLFGVPTFPVENSWNLGMDFLEGAIIPPVLGPSYSSFDPEAEGTYSFSLVAYNKADPLGTGFGSEAARVGMNVVVSSSVVPEPSTYVLMAAGLAGLGMIARRRRNNA